MFLVSNMPGVGYPVVAKSLGEAVEFVEWELGTNVNTSTIGDVTTVFIIDDDPVAVATITKSVFVEKREYKTSIASLPVVEAWTVDEAKTMVEVYTGFILSWEKKGPVWYGDTMDEGLFMVYEPSEGNDE